MAPKSLSLLDIDSEDIVESSLPYEQSEKKALIQIYEACGGPEWKKKGRWLSNPEPNTWFGVVIEQGRVTKLMLPSNNLRGELPDVFAALPYLKVLYLNNNSLGGCIPVSIGGLSKLECLDLSKNELAGNIPRSIGGCFSLKRILLDHNMLDGDIPSTIGCLSNLKWIDFRDNSFADQRK
jgi:Leucine-rich repeat (LRR) protein